MKTKSTETLIENLAADLKPVKPLAPPLTRAALWAPLTVAVSSFLLILLGSLRPGFYQDLLASPRFLIEVAIGLIAGLVTTYAAFESMVPGVRWSAKLKFITLLPVIVFIGLVFYGLFDPSLQPSWRGWRRGCEKEILLIGFAPMIVLFLLGGRGASTDKEWSGFLIGLASAIPAAVGMHLACMYSPGHILVFHHAPVIALGALGYFLGRRFLNC